ncbi:MAG: hypothetical protein O2864_03175 [Crenarchaeota archaeon]|nr:hypothetical protein [Thermoproteota archaeon]
MVKKNSDYKKPQDPKSFGAFLKKRAPIYLGLIGLFLLFVYPALTEKDLNSILDDSFEGNEKIAIDMVRFYSGLNDSGITILEVIEEKINEKHEGQKIFDDENTHATFFVDPIPPFLEANNEFTHQVTFTFDAENNQSLVYSWFVNIENGEVSPIDDDAKNIQQTVDYSD